MDIQDAFNASKRSTTAFQEKMHAVIDKERAKAEDLVKKAIEDERQASKTSMQKALQDEHEKNRANLEEERVSFSCEEFNLTPAHAGPGSAGLFGPA